MWNSRGVAHRPLLIVYRSAGVPLASVPRMNEMREKVRMRPIAAVNASITPSMPYLQLENSSYWVVVSKRHADITLQRRH